MTRPRDTYRQRCYDAERETFGWYGYEDHHGLALPDWAGVEKFARRIERSEWWYGRSPAPGRPVNVIQRTSAANRSNASRSRWIIRIAPGQFRKDLIVHEYAHILTPDYHAAHGPEWVGCYLDGIKDLIGGKAAGDLAAALSRRDVPGPKLPGFYR